MLIVIKLFAKDQSECDSPELDSPMPSSSEMEEKPEESELDAKSLLGAETSERTHTKVPLECSEKGHLGPHAGKVAMLSVQHCMPLAFSSQSIYLESENSGLHS